VTLYKETDKGFEPWLGEPINNVRYPTNIEALWTPEELDKLGLVQPKDDGPPPDKIVTGTTLVRSKDGSVHVVYIAEDPPPPDPEDYPLTARQIRLGLIRNGVALSAVQAAINALPTALQRDEAQIYWEFSTEYHWEHPMTQALLMLTSINSTAARAMWLAAKDYEV